MEIKINNMIYVTRKSLLYKSKVEYADFCINHIEGCSHGCKFPCYAYLMAKRFGRVKSFEDWCKPKLVINALELLDKEIPKYKDEIKFVHLCFMTDPFMYGYKEIEDMTLRIINKLNSNGIKCSILTKGIYPKELTNTKEYSDKNDYGITLVSLNEDFKKRLEPNSSPYIDRIYALKRLHEAGLSTWVSIEPYPTPELIKQDLKEILEQVSFVDKIIFGKLNYNLVSSMFPNNKQFYEKHAELVENFCKERGIKCHIKEGTKSVYNDSTSKILGEH